MKRLLFSILCGAVVALTVPGAEAEYTKEIVDLNGSNSKYRLIVNNTKINKRRNIVYLYSVQIANDKDQRFSLKDSYFERKFVCNAFGHGDPDSIADPILSMNQAGKGVLILENGSETLARANRREKYNAIDMIPCRLKRQPSSTKVSIDF